MKRTIIISIFFIIIFSSCKNKTDNNFIYLNSIFVDVSISDTITGKFILDTGSPITLIDSSFVLYNAIELDSIDAAEIAGSGNSKAKSTTIFNNLELYVLEKKINTGIIVIYDLKKIIPVEDGIIGMNFFEKNIVKIDYQNQKISILNSTEEIDNQFSKIPLIVKNNRLYIKLKLKVNDSISVEGLFLIDTGSEFAIKIDNYYSDSLDLFNKIENKIIKDLKNTGIGGKSKKFLIKGEKAKISNFELQNILVSCSLNKNGAESYQKGTRIGTIGNLFLENFVVILSLNDKSLYLKPNKKYSEKFTYIRSGISLGEKTNKGFRIKSILNLKSTKNQNINENDILTVIDNKNTTELGYFKTRLLLQKKGKHKLKLLRKKDIIEQSIYIDDLMKLL